MRYPLNTTRTRFMMLSVLLLMLLIVQSGCSKKPMSSADYAYISEINEAPIPDVALSPPESIGNVTSADDFGDRIPDINQSSSVSPLENRKIVYNATLKLIIPNIESALIDIENIINEENGYIQESSLNRIKFRIPPSKFKETVDKIMLLGEVVVRDIKSDDITMEYVDLETRIKMAEKSKDRLVELMNNVETTKDLLEVERDIRRLMEEIERMKGALRVMSDQVQMATITVMLETRIIDTRSVSRRKLYQYAWTQTLGIENTFEYVSPYARISGRPWISRLIFGTPFALGSDNDRVVPDGFLIMKHTANKLVANTPEDYRLRAMRMEANQEAPLELWAKSIKSNFENSRGYKVEGLLDVSIDNSSLTCIKLECSTIYSGESWSYTLWLVQKGNDRKRLLAVEWARLAKEGTLYKDEIDQAIKGISLK